MAVDFYERYIVREELPLAIVATAQNENTSKEKGENEGGGGQASDFLKIHLGLLLWLVLLAFGGGLLSLYYENVNYFPDIQWQESLTYLGALSIIGGTIVLFYALLLLIPGVIWSEFLIFDDDLKWHLCYRGYKDLEPCIVALLRRIVMPFAIFIVPIHLLLSDLSGHALFAVTISLMMAACSAAYFANKKDAFRQPMPMWRHLSISGRYMAFFSFSMLISLVALLFIREILVKNVSALSPLSLICTGMIILSNIAVALQFKKRRLGAYVSGIMAALILLVAGHRLAEGEKPSVRFMSSFGLGSKVTMLLNERGARIFDLHGISVTPPLPPLTGDEQQKNHNASFFKAEGIEILSHLGSEYFLRSPARQQSFSVPKEVVISWAYDRIPAVSTTSESVSPTDTGQMMAGQTALHP